MQTRISMRDIARKAGVSVMTVSLALRDSTRISQATRQRIKKLAEKMQFKPDPALRALISYRHQQSESRFAGVLAYINNSGQDLITESDEHHRGLFEGAGLSADRLGYKLVEFWLNEPGLKGKPDRASDILTARGIQGLMISPQKSADTSIDLNWDLFSSVQLFASLKWPRLHTVSNDVYLSMQTVCKRLCQLGYRQIGLAIRDSSDRRVQYRYSAAYLGVQHRLPRSHQRIPPLIQESFSAVPFLDWFKKHRPDAIITFFEELPNCLESNGIRVPGDVGVAAPYPLPQMNDLAHACPARGQVGGLAAAVLASQIEKNERGIPDQPITHTTTPVWNPGNSLRPVGSPVELDLPSG